MIKLDDGRYIIGFDNGYQLGKTATEIFDNGVHAMGDVEPSLKEHSLYYQGNYYKVCEGRAVITDDKVSDENTRLLTMVALAKELMKENVTSANVLLAVGLPFSDYGREKNVLKEYYERKPILQFIYEGVEFHVKISRVIVCTQCYAAIAPRIGNMRDDYLIVNIGSKTTDVVYVKEGMPIESKSITIEKATVKWMKQIQSTLQVQFGKDVPESEILKVILEKNSMLPRQYIILIKETLSEQIRNLELELAEREYDMEYTKIIYVGGGSVIAKNYITGYRGNAAYDCDLKANAMGYEFLAKMLVMR